MSSTKRYQVFVSSTYTDLKDERDAVSQTILEMQHFPVGMERWPAADEEQFGFIRRVIDESDYYLVIIGQRYGTLADDGISYTEKEYHYAVSKGLKIIALVQEPDVAPKTDVDPNKQRRLDAFREKLKKGRLVKIWKSKEELTNAVLHALHHALVTHPATGWMRADQIASVEALSDIVTLQKENKELRALLNDDQPVILDIAGLDEEFTIKGYFRDLGSQSRAIWNCRISWRNIFEIVAVQIEISPAEQNVARESARLFVTQSGSGPPEGKYGATTWPETYAESWHCISRQLRALRLVTHTPGENGTLWRLTRGGEDLFLASQAIRTERSEE